MTGAASADIESRAGFERVWLASSRNRRNALSLVRDSADLRRIVLSFGVLGSAVFLVLGGAWCWEILRRWRRDFDEIRSSTDSNTRIVIGGLWVVTALILVFWIRSVAGILDGIGIV